MAGILVRAALLLATAAGPALAQQHAVISSGAAGVMVDGRAAARAGDTTSDGRIVQGSSNVFINGKPAAVAGDSTDCGGRTLSGSHGVVINGKPMARQGDVVSGCPGK